MNLAELYEKTPGGKHGNIKVTGDRVLVRGEDQSCEEYLIDTSGELWLIHSNREEKQALTAIKNKLGITEVSP